MHAAVYYNNKDVRLEERTRPNIGPGELLLKVMACGICGSDVLEWYRVPRAPLVLGHEVTGEIVELGEEVDRYRVGQRVFVTHHVPCNSCKYCLAGHHSVCDTLRSTNLDPGGFAEYVRVPSINVERGVFPLPEEMSYEEGVFIEPLACAVRGQRLARFRPGHSVAVLGSGTAGLLHAALARAMGAGRIIATDLSSRRLQMAKRLGADAVIHAGEDVPRRLREENDGLGADLVIVCTGALPALEQALHCVDRGGTILFFAPTNPGVTLSLPFNDLWKDEISIVTSYAGAPRDIVESIELLRLGRVQVKDMISHRLPLSEAGRGFQLVAEARDSIKVVIEPQKIDRNSLKGSGTREG